MGHNIDALATGGMVYVSLPSPDALAENAMRIHHTIDLLLAAHLGPGCGKNAIWTGEIKSVLEMCSDLARRLGCDIDRLAQAGR